MPRSHNAGGPLRCRCRSLTIVMLIGVLPGLSCAGEEPRIEVTDHLVDRLDTMVAAKPQTQPPMVSWLELGFDRRRALLENPPSTYSFPGVTTSGAAVLELATGMAPGASGSGTDGVGFRVHCVDPQGDRRTLLELEIRPNERRQDRTWQDRKIPLSACASPTTLVLQTTCGRPGSDCRRWGAAYWGDPRVVRLQAPPPERVKRLALLVSIDTLRPDHMGMFGADRPTTPQLDRLAEDAVVFDTVVAPAPWTVPSHASLLTSTDPDVHGATTKHDIDPHLPSISGVLSSAGWTTAGFVDTPWLGRFGFPRGFDHYDAKPPPPGSSRRGVAITRERLLRWLEKTEGDAFVFWHVMDVHGPYGAPAPFGGRFRARLDTRADPRMAELARLSYHQYLQLNRFRSVEDMKAAYDEGVAYVDAEIGSLIEALRRSGLYDEALIVITADHGESFMDHGVWVGHGLFLTDDEIRIPLLIKLPGNRHAGLRVEEMVRLIDVAPTILDVLDVEAPPSFEGQSLVSPEPGQPGALPRVAFGSSSNTGAEYVRDNRTKLITPWPIPRQQVIATNLRPQADSPLLSPIESDGRFFDLVADPGERSNLIHSAVPDSRASELQRLLSRRARWVKDLKAGWESKPGPDAADLSAEDIDRLRSLGYLGGSN